MCGEEVVRKHAALEQRLLWIALLLLVGTVTASVFVDLNGELHLNEMQTTILLASGSVGLLAVSIALTVLNRKRWWVLAAVGALLALFFLPAVWPW